jgi:hypothetical protein
MKNPKQKLKNILLLVTVLFAFSCSKDSYDENLNLDPETSVKTSRVSLNQVLNDLNNTAIKKNLNELILVNSQNNSTSRVSNSEVYFTKKEKENVLVSYLLNINSYTQLKPYFLKLIITNNANEQCKIGYLKYVPTSTETSLDLHTFTGEVQILNFNFEITAKSNYINGIKQQDVNTSSRITCVNEINVTEVKCSTTGNHGVGELCKPPFINDAHFVVTIFERCTSRSGDLVQIIEDTSGTGNSNTGGVFPASIILNPFLDTLSEEQLVIYNANPNMEEYLLNNLVVVPNNPNNPLTGDDSISVITKPEVEEEVKNLINILSELETNPNLLLNVPCNQLPYWQTISQHVVPNTVIKKIEKIDNQSGWFESANIQSLGHPNNGATVNMDFFPVTISQMPKKPNGVTYTQKELFNHIRLNINAFFDNLTFTPVVNSSYGLNETALWNSTNPLGAILSINIVPDEGSVVCSKFNEITGEWYFTTIEVPWDGTHPVSGHRAFGYYTDVNGKMVIYTRGVDRYSFGTHMLGNTGATLEAASQLAAFSSADAKWQSFQQKIANFVNQGQGNGLNGASNVNVPEKYRPDWNKVKNVLNGTQPISTLGCN